MGVTTIDYWQALLERRECRRRKEKGKEMHSRNCGEVLFSAEKYPIGYMVLNLYILFAVGAVLFQKPILRSALTPRFFERDFLKRDGDKNSEMVWVCGGDNWHREMAG